METIELGLLGLTSSHSHILGYMCRVGNIPETSITVFTTPEKKAKIENGFEDVDAFNWVLPDDGESQHQFLDRVETQYTQTLDLLIINTISGNLFDYLDFYRFRPTCRTLCWIYAINTWFDPKYLPTVDPKKFLNVNGSLFLKRLLRNRFDGFVVEYELMKEYLENETSFRGDVAYLTHAVFDEDTVPPLGTSDDTTRCVVPGSPLPRRNYEMVFDVFDQLFERFGDDLELTILGPLDIDRGGGVERAVLERCRDLDASGYNIRYYTDDWIPFDEFNDRLAESDICLNPLQIFERINTGRTREIMGITHGTGTLFDPLRFGKPMLLPEQYPVSSDIEPLVHAYENRQEFRQILTSFLEEPSCLDEASQRAREHARNYDIDNQRQMFRERILKPITDQ